MRTSGSILLLGILALAIAGCSKTTADARKANDEAEKFLKWSMNQNAALTSYQASVAWSASAPMNQSETREIAYERPNKFKVSTVVAKDEKMTAVSDGAKMIEIANVPGGGVVSSPSPKTMAEADGMQISHPMFNGSLLYQFFAGSDNFDALVDTASGPVEFGDQNVAEPSEQARTVLFHGTRGYGIVEAVIGSKTGLVYKITYDGLAEMMKGTPAMQQYGDKLPTVIATESYSNIKTGEQLAATTFDTTPPKGMEVHTASDDGSNPPVPIGKPIPDIELTSLDGKAVKLSSFKGKIVMIDFWATWCPPCREGLPITNKMHELYGSKGLQVLTASTEEPATIAAFVKENKYTFAVYRDPNGVASQKYNVTGIPCTVIVDAKGNLAAYLVGLRPEGEILESLKKAGLKP